MLTAQDLAGPWTLRAAGPVPEGFVGVDIPAAVPGCVHVDLMRDGRLEDPFLDDNETRVAWVGRSDWTYAREVAWDGPTTERVDLVFEGLDTVADIRVGGVMVGATRNMHRTYRFDVTGLAAQRSGPGRGPVHVRLHGGGEGPGRARSASERVPGAVQLHPEDGLQLRLGLGSDPGDRRDLAPGTAGGMEYRAVGRRPSTGDLSAARVGSTSRSMSSARRRGVTPTCGRRCWSTDGRSPSLDLAGGATSVRAAVDVPDVAAWFPRGYGEQPLYDLVVVLTDGEAVLDRWARRTGFRTVDGRYLGRRGRLPIRVPPQRRAGARQGRQLDPGRHLPGPDDPAAIRAAAARGGRRRRQPGPRVGRRHL